MTDEQESKNVTSYDIIADKWNDFRKNCVVNKCVIEFCDFLPKGADILDAGCGTGFPVSSYLISEGYCVTGIDPSEKMLEKARELHLPNAIFIKSDFLSFVGTVKYDAIIAFDSLWYIPSEKQYLIYAKASDLLRQGGYFMFTHGCVHGETEGEMFGEKFYYAALSCEEIKNCLELYGFDVLRFEKNYAEKTTGQRDLLVFAKKR